jgi:hypothetical protein
MLQIVDVLPLSCTYVLYIATERNIFVSLPDGPVQRQSCWHDGREGGKYEIRKENVVNLCAYERWSKKKKEIL